MEKYVKAATLDNDFEAQILKSILEERAIPHYFKSFYDSAYDGLFQRSGGWGAVFAPENFVGEIVALLEDIRR